MNLRKYIIGGLVILGIATMLALLFTACDPLEGSFEKVLEAALETGKTGGDSNTPSVSVGMQQNDLPAIFNGDVKLIVVTANINNGTYTPTVANLPVGISVNGNVTINNNMGELYLEGSLNTVAGTYSNLRLTINGVTSPNFTLIISAAGTKSVYIQGTQSNSLRRGTAGNVTYTLITANIANNTPITLSTGVIGVTLTPVSTTYNSTTISLNTTTGTPGGFHKLTLTVDGTTSPQFDLIVKDIISVTASSSGRMYAKANNQELTFTVTTAGIIGSHTPAVSNCPAGVNVSGVVNIYNNTGVLTLAGNTSTNAGSYTNLSLTIDGVTSSPFMLTIEPEKTITVTGSQSGDLWQKANNSVTYALTTTSIGNGSYPVTIDLPITGVSGTVDINGSSKTLTLTGSSSTVTNDYTGRTITIESDGINVTSANTFTLRIINNPSGDGSEGNPFLVPYIPEGGSVTNSVAVAALQKVGSGTDGWSATAHYKQTMDINLSSVSNWTPSYNFSGVYDGNGKTISNLKNTGSSEYIGLFSFISVSGTVKNVRLTNVSLTGSSRVGGIAGENIGTVQSCSVSGTVNCDQYGGGVVGLNNGTVKNCSSSVNITGTQAGGVVGYNTDNNNSTYKATVQNCYATGSVNGSQAGGVVGSFLIPQGNGKVENCVALNISITGGGGRVIGVGDVGVNNYGSTATTGGTWVNNAAGKDGADVTDAIAKTTAFWTTAGNWSGGAWSSDVWTFTAGSYPVLK